MSHIADDLLFEHVRPGATPIADVESHLASCGPCRLEAERLRDTLGAMAALAPPPMEADGAIRDALGRGGPRPRIARRLALLAAAVALSASAAFAGWQLRGWLAPVATPAPTPEPIASAAATPSAAPSATPRLARASATPAANASAAPGAAPEFETAEILYVRAEREVAAGQVAEAARTLETLRERFPGTPTANLALFELARLRETSLGDARGAAAAYREYLELGADAPLAADARRGLCRVLPEDPDC